MGEPATVHVHKWENLDADKATAYSAAFPSADLHVGVVRLKGAATDCVISLHGAAAAAAAAGAVGDGAGDGTEGPAKPLACPSLVGLVDSLEVLDWGLFGGDEGS